MFKWSRNHKRVAQVILDWEKAGLSGIPKVRFVSKQSTVHLRHVPKCMTDFEDQGWLERPKDWRIIVPWSEGRLTEEGRKELALHADGELPKQKLTRRIETKRLKGTLYPDAIVPATQHLFKPGHRSSKLGFLVTKGFNKGRRILSLSLEERKTCPSACPLWENCYGNHMTTAHRVEHGPELEERLFRWARNNTKDVLIRLHELGDFYSIDYVRLWKDIVLQYPSVNVFGYTARDPYDDPIGWEVFKARKLLGRRFMIRFGQYDSFVTELYPGEGFWCPEQSGKVKNCAECAACWNGTKTVLFKPH